jgi:hypothetical protein
MLSGRYPLRVEGGAQGLGHNANKAFPSIKYEARNR